ncbi:MAG: type I restriction endonuclease subunit R [Schwartzia succinivorans]|uniref:type I restriction endonuclease subunit R n=1 Tax=Schwartzia succinivorans TaxID=55507 RepID=UPI0023574717|nr:DEAD/DEAH box helicase family protein [Schwartzia succinivorans]MBE6097622.1 type I restriction endonuclease subunit R [Schwartzia succinivorans]
MNKILTEKEYQSFILERLTKDNGFILRNAATDYDRLFALDRELLFDFLNDTQPDEMTALRKIYKDKTEETIVNFINQQVTAKRGSLIGTLKSGIEPANGITLKLMYDKPASTMNPELFAKYKKNRFSVMEEVWASDDERIDLVIFLNGFAIMTFELKCNFAGQSYEDAIYQYRTDRDPKTRLFRFKSGALVNFAMDLNEVHMSTRLNKKETFFLPFNQGNGEGMSAGKGNPLYDDRFSVSYMWEDILQKDMLLELLHKFIFIEVEEKKDEATGKNKTKETLIFPRYHQLDAVRKLLADVSVNGSSMNYLIQHSAGSGKTNSIAWLAHRLASLHDNNDSIIFHHVIIMTDRVVVDRQLQAAVLSIEHASGLIRVMDDSCSSADLAQALNQNTKIIVTTIQKFPYIVDEVKNLKEQRFAVIIDEAHSSTAGKNMAAVTKSLASTKEQDEDVDMEEAISEEIRLHGKQSNVSMFAFTATPKATTLKMFGRLNQKGMYEAFHTYSMKQAIEEGFILDVLLNYTTYETFYKINKAVADDPKLKTAEAKRKIARYAALHDTNIAQRIEIIIEHFRTTIMDELGGTGKAMVVTGSRHEAVKYKEAFDKYITKKGYKLKAIVAFSGKVKHKGDDLSESKMNGFPEEKTRDMFDTPIYQVMIVANKYQTGFDQKRLCAMYILKKLRGVAAVQTLSRLNRICPPYDKKTFILDFVNDYKDIEKAFSAYYTVTFLSNSVKPESIYELEARIDGYGIFDDEDVEKVADILYGNSRDKKTRIAKIMYKTQKLMEHYTDDDHRLLMKLLRGFVRYYDFLIQVSCFEDHAIHKKYIFISCLLAYVNIRHSGSGFDIRGKVTASNFVQKKKTEYIVGINKSSPVLTLPVPDNINVSPELYQKLSEIIDDINSRTGKGYDRDVAIKAMLQIKDIMLKSDELRISAHNNTAANFEFSFFDRLDDILIDGMEQNQDFFTLLLKNDDIKHQAMGIFADEIYKELREDHLLPENIEHLAAEEKNNPYNTKN